MRWWANCDEMARRVKVTRTSGTDARALIAHLRDTRSACCPTSYCTAPGAHISLAPESVTDEIWEAADKHYDESQPKDGSGPGEGVPGKREKRQREAERDEVEPSCP